MARKPVGRKGQRKTEPQRIAVVRAASDHTEVINEGATLEEAEARYWERRRGHESQLARAMMELGSTEDSRLRFLLALLDRPLKRMTDDEWAVLHTQLRFLAPHHPSERQEILPWPPTVPTTAERRTISRALRALSECLTNLAAGKEYACDVPAGQRVFSPPQRRGNGRGHAVIGTRFFVRGPAAVIHAVIDMLEHVGADRLKRCPFPGSPQERPCGRLFLAKHRREVFCTRRHAKRAAYLNWWRDTKGGTRAKQ